LAATFSDIIMNQVFNNLVAQNFKNFKNSFDNTKEVFWDVNKGKLIHPGEFGAYRETLAKTWLKTFIPSKFGLGNGFLITSKNRISTQCDIIIYDKDETPTIENLDNQKFYPIETVAGVIEIKSDIHSIGELNAHLIKLSELKTFRNDIIDPTPYNRGGFAAPFNPERIPFDNIFTILIFNKLDFRLNINDINYGQTPVKYHHNLVLSLNDGIINYSTKNNTKGIFFSFVGDQFHSMDFSSDDTNSDLPIYIKNFLNSLHYLLKSTCLHKLDVSYYFEENPTKHIY
jgi:hypothetical protein